MGKYPSKSKSDRVYKRAVGPEFAKRNVSRESMRPGFTISLTLPLGVLLALRK